ncbi:MAG: hypothetical protein P8Y48_03080 [Novosphingobium sp.]
MATEAGPDNTGETAKSTRRKGKNTPSPADLHGPSPNIATNLAIADIALRGGTALARQAIERALLGRKYAPSKAAKILKGRTMGESLLHGALAKVALRSVPGAIVIGGALIAKTLYDRTKAREARREGEAELEEMARNGEEQ